MKKMLFILLMTLGITSLQANTLTIKTISNSNVRSCESIKCKLLTTLDKGTIIENAIKEKWYKIELENGKIGYIYPNIVSEIIVSKEEVKKVEKKIEKEKQVAENKRDDYFASAFAYALLLISIGAIGGFLQFLMNNKVK